MQREEDDSTLSEAGNAPDFALEQELITRTWREVWDEFYAWKVEHVQLPSLASLDPPNPIVTTSALVPTSLASFRSLPSPASELTCNLWDFDDVDPPTPATIRVPQAEFDSMEPYPPYESCVASRKSIQTSKDTGIDFIPYSDEPDFDAKAYLGACPDDDDESTEFLEFWRRGDWARDPDRTSVHLEILLLAENK